MAALATNGRAPWQALADLAGLSTSTAQRRVARLIDAGLVRIIGATDVVAAGFGITALVRIHCSADHIAEVQRALTRRADVRFCASVTGTAAIVTDMAARSMADLAAALAELMATLPVTGTETFPTTRTFTAPFTVFPQADPRTLEADTHANAPAPDASHGVPQLARHATGTERAVLGAVVEDGRRPVTDIAAQTGLPESTVRRTIDDLITSGRLRIGPLVAPLALGLEVALFVWLSVDPSRVRDAAARLAETPGVHAAFASLGRFNLVAQVFLPGIADVYSFSTERLGSIPGVRDLEVTVQVHTTKRMWIGVTGGRFDAELPARPTITTTPKENA
ncbi:hypothetical protein BGP79_01360 [Tersicoccus sp. Bi-70]|nr:hypothetical protein BGP79_01360 [Tersicoccus sp. Bi-70]